MVVGRSGPSRSQRGCASPWQQCRQHHPFLPPVFIPSTASSPLSQDTDLHFQEREASFWWRLKDHLWVLWCTFQIMDFKGGEIIARFAYLMDLELQAFPKIYLVNTGLIVNWHSAELWCTKLALICKMLWKTSSNLPGSKTSVGEEGLSPRLPS